METDPAAQPGEESPHHTAVPEQSMDAGAANGISDPSEMYMEAVVETQDRSGEATSTLDAAEATRDNVADTLPHRDDGGDDHAADADAVMESLGVSQPPAEHSAGPNEPTPASNATTTGSDMTASASSAASPSPPAAGSEHWTAVQRRIVELLQKLVAASDVDKLTMNDVKAFLKQENLRTAYKEHKDFVKEQLAALISAASGEAVVEQGEEDEDMQPRKKRRRAATGSVAEDKEDKEESDLPRKRLKKKADKPDKETPKAKGLIFSSVSAVVVAPASFILCFLPPFSSSFLAAFAPSFVSSAS